MNQIINMIIRQVMRQLVNRGVNAGFQHAGKLGRKRGTPPQGAAEAPTPEERRAKRQARQASGQARQSLKIMRRMGKF